jgi:hypothetical protein
MIKPASMIPQSIIHAKEFYLSKNEVPLFAVPNVNVWLRFSVNNASSLDELYLFIEHFNVSKITLYEAKPDLVPIYVDGNELYHRQIIPYPNTLQISSSNPEAVPPIIMHVESAHPVVFPAYIGPKEAIDAQIKRQIFTVSVYFGIVAAVFFVQPLSFFLNP